MLLTVPCLFRIATKSLDVVLNPLQREPLIEESGVLLAEGDLGRIREAKD